MKRQKPIELTEHKICLAKCERVINIFCKYLNMTGKQRIHLFDDDYNKIKSLLAESGFDTSGGMTILGAPIIGSVKR